MDRIKGRSDFTELQGDRYRHCHVCGPVTYRAIIHFDSGSTAPTVGETVTGATSGHTGIIEFAQLTSGTYVGGDAAGVLILTSPTGHNHDSLRIFSEDENLSGSSSGDNFCDVDGTPTVNINGRLHPDWNLIEYRGLYYCKEHFEFMFRKEWEDEEKISTDEPLRGK
jgi:hypothetical protein